MFSRGGASSSGEGLETVPPVSTQDFQASSLVYSPGIFPSAPWGWEGVGEPGAGQTLAGLELPGGGGKRGESWARGATCRWLLVPCPQCHPSGSVQMHKKWAYKRENTGHSIAAGQRWEAHEGRGLPARFWKVSPPGASGHPCQGTWWDPRGTGGWQGRRREQTQGGAGRGSPCTGPGQLVTSVSG